MRILLDQNLSPKLSRRLADILPGLESVYDHDLTGSSDPYIFEWARRAEFAAVVSTDVDFARLAERLGPPPKAIRIERCDFPIADNRSPSAAGGTSNHAFLESDRAVLLLAL